MADKDDKPDANDGQGNRWMGKVLGLDCKWSSLSVSLGTFETEVDWEGEHGFFNDPNIKLESIAIEIEFSGIEKASAQANFESFCRGLSGNRTIQELIVQGFGPSNVDMFSMLAPFFEHNKKLKRFISLCGDLLSSSAINAIGKCNNLEEVEVVLSSCASDNELAGQFISAMAEHNSCLFRLSLAESNINNLNGWVELAEMLKASRSIKELNLQHNGIGDRELAVLGDALRGGTSIKTLNLGMNMATDNGWQAFAEGLETNTSLDTLVVSNTEIGDAGAAALSNSIHNTLKTLDFSLNVHLTPNGWCSFFTTLLGLNSVLESLDVSYCIDSEDEVVNDEIAFALANALGSNTSLKSLVLFSLESVSSEALQALWSSVVRALFNDKSLDTIQEHATNYTPLTFLIPPLERQARVKAYTPSTYYASRLLVVQRGYTPPDLRLG